MHQLTGIASLPDGRQALLLAQLPLAHIAVALQMLLHQLGQLLLRHTCMAEGDCSIQSGLLDEPPTP